MRNTWGSLKFQHFVNLNSTVHARCHSALNSNTSLGLSHSFHLKLLGFIPYVYCLHFFAQWLTLAHFSRNSAWTLCHPWLTQIQHFQFIKLNNKSMMYKQTWELGGTIAAIKFEQHTTAHRRARHCSHWSNTCWDWAVLFSVMLGLRNAPYACYIGASHPLIYIRTSNLDLSFWNIYKSLMPTTFLIRYSNI